MPDVFHRRFPSALTVVTGIRQSWLYSDSFLLAAAVFVFSATATRTRTVAGGFAYDCELRFLIWHIKKAHLSDLYCSFRKPFSFVGHGKHFVRGVATIGVLMGAVIQVLIQSCKLSDVPLLIKHKAMGLYNIDDLLHGGIHDDNLLNTCAEGIRR